MRILDNLIYRAEELDEVKIQYRLAVIYQTGDRVEQDLEQARHWFERAAENGHEEAARILATMGAKPVESKVPKVTKAKRRGESKVKSSADDLPPVIPRKPRRQALDLESGLEGTTDNTGQSVGAEDLGRKLGLQLGEFFGRKPRAVPPRAKAEETDSTVEAFPHEEGVPDPTKKKSGIGCDAVWIVGGIIYVLAKSCSG